MSDAPAQPRLSAILIVKNEEANLPRCLASLAGLADEVVVVDTGSTDRTVEIAREAGAAVHFFPWNGVEADARNVSIARASGRWLFQIDADEEVSPELRREIVRELNRIDALEPPDSTEIPNALSFVLRNVYLHGAASRSRLFRIGRAAPDYAFHGIVHPTPNYLPPYANLRGELLHHGYQWTPETRRRKGIGLLERLALRPAEERRTLRHFSETLMALLIVGEDELFRREWQRRRQFTSEEKYDGPEAVLWSHALCNALNHFAASADFSSGEGAAVEMLSHRPTHVRSVLHLTQGAVRREEWSNVWKQAQRLVGIGFDFTTVDFFQAIPVDAAPALRAWRWLAAVIDGPEEEGKTAPPQSIWHPQLLPIFWRAEQRRPGRIVLPDNLSTGVLGLRAGLDALGAPGGEAADLETVRRVDSLTAAALKRLTPGGPGHLLSLVTRFWLNRRFVNHERAAENLALARLAAERYTTIRWLDLALPLSLEEELKPGAFGAFYRRALVRLCG
ncbi:Glycosyl transferase family 2 [Verrucomicrobium sp. GAS474]|uniref:glycosyltransferase family 2 protein n=1 Tax=Verrucomicrobium sp. GAS474 TaxID=1882831 RepID=UPI0008795A9D|nr:glycosyltransferase family 2 protein [Verrucomicrobium sp. GAS474]SDT92502.1 Glycosyl transferase family 2 [Verrucomicrobium sp. GAS474]